MCSRSGVPPAFDFLGKRNRHAPAVSGNAIGWEFLGVNTQGESESSTTLPLANGQDQWSNAALGRICVLNSRAGALYTESSRLGASSKRIMQAMGNVRAPGPSPERSRSQAPPRWNRKS